ncbi:MAG: SDR family NAD(P)-dependent oxidoreductase [Rhodospirillales bacterium]
MTQRFELAPPPGSRIAVVGGCGGIGRVLVEALADAGSRVAVLDLPASVGQHPPGSSELTIQLDASDEASVNAAFEQIAEQFMALDGLVNLAGFTRAKIPVADMTLADWEDILAGNLRSTFLCCKAAMPLLRQGGNPAIVNMASGLATRLMPGYGPYGAAKAGVIAMTKALAIENAPDVRANTVAPGAVDTAFLRGGTGQKPGGNSTQLDVTAYTKTIPMGRIAVPEDIVGPMLFLLGPASAYMTGQVLHINGGSLTP